MKMTRTWVDPFMGHDPWVNFMGKMGQTIQNGRSYANKEGPTVIKVTQRKKQEAKYTQKVAEKGEASNSNLNMERMQRY